MKNCIFFASYIPTNDKLYVGIEILDKLIEFGFDKHDLFIGINPSNVTNEWINIIESYRDRFSCIKYSIVEKEFVVNSDVSAYQEALKLYKENHNTYNLCWFIHTKGVTSNKDDFRELLYKIFYSKKNEIEKIFDNKNIGFFCPFMYHIQGNQWTDYIHNNLKHILIDDKLLKNTNLSCYYTHYVLRGEIIKNFVNDVDVSFFKKNLLSLGVEQKYDRYFFERDFPMIYEKYGYNPYSNDFSWVEKYK